MAKLSPGEELRRNQMFTQGFLWCNFCKQFKAVKHFYKAESKNYVSQFGYRRYCAECEYSKRSTVHRKFQNERNHALKRQFVGLAGGSCHRCGYNEFVSGFDFHHVYPSEKECEAVRIIYSGNFKAAWVELDKCCLLCRNCHSVYEANEWRAEFIKREGLGWTVGQTLPLEDDRYSQKPARIQQSAFPIHLLKTEPIQLAF